MTTWADYMVAAMLGAAFGMSEIVSRYRDSPTEAARSTAGMVYVAINAMTAAASLFVVRTFGWTFGAQGEPIDAKVRTVQVLVTGFASMALLRSSFFTVRIGNQDVGVGLNAEKRFYQSIALHT